MTDNSLHNVYLGLGSNLGNRKENIQRAIDDIRERIGEVIACSALYTTPPVGFDSDNQFLNAACHVQTLLDPSQILTITQEIECELGRKTKSVNHSYADRTIDIDILLFDDLILNSPHLILPHPHMHQRSFVLIPLSDIARDIVHPVLLETIGQLKEKLL